MAKPSDLDARSVSRFDVYGFERGGLTVGLPVIGFFAHGVVRNNCDLSALTPGIRCLHLQGSARCRCRPDGALTPINAIVTVM